MARPLKKKRKTARRTSNKKKAASKIPVIRIIAALAIMLLLVVGAGFLVQRILMRKPPAMPAAKTPVQHRHIPKPPPFEVFPLKEHPPAPPRETPQPTVDRNTPKVAIIIDDIGYDRVMARKFMHLDPALTLSILPESTFLKSIAGEAHENGVSVMLHQPMEPKEYPHTNPGPGALLSAMTPDQRIRQLIRNIDSIPFVVGVNNHMGSRMTADADQMRQIFSVLKKRGLFFVDSRTTPETLCRPSAVLLQLPFADRDVFLDHRQDRRFIQQQMRELMRIAGQYGAAVGIGHPYPMTLAVLEEQLPALKRSMSLVPVAQLVQ